MSIESRRELELTRTKLKLLEERLAALAQEREENRRAHEWSIRSLTQTINQMTEAVGRDLLALAADSPEAARIIAEFKIQLNAQANSPK